MVCTYYNRHTLAGVAREDLTRSPLQPTGESGAFASSLEWVYTTNGGFMTKVHFVALADAIRDHNIAVENDNTWGRVGFSKSHLTALADFCEAQNPRFDRERWLNYIAGTHTANGRKL